MVSLRRMRSLTFVVKFDRGLAERHRLPLDHVLSTLRELRAMVEETGRDLQRQKGVENPTGDFGMELLAGFKKGSFQVNIALTRDVRIGRAAVEEIIGTVNWLATMDGRIDEIKKPEDGASKIVRRLSRIAEIQKNDKTEMRLELRDGRKKAAATFDDAAIASTKVLAAPQFQMEGITVYGKLFGLRDSTPDAEDGNHFWGELRRENGEMWRVRFKAEIIGDVLPLFRKQVAITGMAVYYPAQSPKLIADKVAQDTDRDYEAAFDELYGCNREIYGTDLHSLLREIRGDT